MTSSQPVHGDGLPERTWYACTECGKETALPEHHEEAEETVMYACSKCGITEHEAGERVNPGKRTYRCTACNHHHEVSKLRTRKAEVRLPCPECSRRQRHFAAGSALDTIDILAAEKTNRHTGGGR